MKRFKWAQSGVLWSVLIALCYCPVMAQVSAPSVPAERVSPRPIEAESLLTQILRGVSAQTMVATPFVERRLSALYSSALESRGTLTYRLAGTLEKQTTNPIRELVTLNSDSVTIDVANTPRKVVKLDAQSGLAGFAIGMRAILAGDTAVLGKFFDLKVTGSMARWQLQLTPNNAAMRRALRSIELTGDGSRLRTIETTESNGDVIELTLLFK